MLKKKFHRGKWFVLRKQYLKATFCIEITKESIYQYLRVNNKHIYQKRKNISQNF